MHEIIRIEDRIKTINYMKSIKLEEVQQSLLNGVLTCSTQFVRIVIIRRSTAWTANADIIPNQSPYVEHYQ